jgi:histidinol-phosphate aminotransferase
LSRLSGISPIAVAYRAAGTIGRFASRRLPDVDANQDGHRDRLQDCTMRSRSEKGGGSFAGIKLLLCENPLPPIDEAIAAAQAEVPRSNYYTEAHSAPLRQVISSQLGVPERLIHINAGSELILRQLFDRFGEKVHLLTPTYPLFPEVARHWTETRMQPEHNFTFDLATLQIPEGTTLAVIVNPNNPNGGTFDMAPLPGLLARHPRTRFLVDEAFIGLAGQSVAALVPRHPNLLVTRTLSKAHSLAGFRVGYAVLPEAIADDLNAHNDAYPLARPSEAAAIATLQHEDKIRERTAMLREWTERLASALRALGVRTFPTETYFFLADFAPHDADALARALHERGILVKALGDERLGRGYMRITTALPEDNARFLAALRELL